MNAAASDNTDGGFVDQLEHAPIISEQDFEVSSQEQPQNTEPKGLRKAVCKSCGSAIEVAADATLEDVASNMPPCCENMELSWAEGE